jgi:hypothetical protein
MDVGEMYRQTHISVAELQAIIAKRFESFNRAKALGFLKILEREYNLDLSDLAAEYETFYGAKNDDKQIFVVAKEEKSAVGKYIIVVLALIAIALGWAFAKFASDDSESATPIVAPPPPTEETAQTEIKPTETIAPIAPIVVPPQNTLINEALQTIIDPKPAETLAPIAIENAQNPIDVAAPTSQFYIIPDGDLWVQVTYADSGEREQRTISSRYDLDSSRDADFLFGHGRFRLINGATVIEPQTNSRQRIRFRSGVLSPITAPSQRSVAQDTRTNDQNTTERN